MLISTPCVVSLTWKLSDAQNREIDQLDSPVEFFFGGDDLLANLKVLTERLPFWRNLGWSLYVALASTAQIGRAHV